MKNLESYISYSTEISDALKNNRPVVALETTIISHGMPYPENFNTAKALEEIIREEGAVPATIGIIDGKIKIGMSKEELEHFAKSQDVLKVSRRDIPYVISKKKNGATTVAATMIFAKMAGIKVFATGGIGGVHRFYSEDLDASADLYEFKETDVAVVSSGVKSILDIPKTREFLETLGVPIIGYQSEEFAAFFTRASGVNVDYRLDNAQEVAEFLYSKWSLDLKGGVVISNPIPKESELNESVINKAIQDALKQAFENKISGKAVTPFLLQKVKEITGGESLKANIALVKNNALVAAQIATQYNNFEENL